MILVSWGQVLLTKSNTGLNFKNKKSKLKN